MRKDRTMHFEVFPSLGRRQLVSFSEMGMQAQREGRKPDWYHHLKFDAFPGSETKRLPLDENTEIGPVHVRKQGGKRQYPKHRRQPHMRAAAPCG